MIGDIYGFTDLNHDGFPDEPRTRNIDAHLEFCHLKTTNWAPL